MCKKRANLQKFMWIEAKILVLQSISKKDMC